MKQGELLINKNPQFSRFPLGNFKSLGLIAPPTVQLYIPAPLTINKEGISKKQVVETQEEATSMNKKPKIAVPNEQMGQGQSASIKSESVPGPSNINQDVFEKMMHPVFRTNVSEAGPKALSKKDLLNDRQSNIKNERKKRSVPKIKEKKKQAIKVQSTGKKNSSSSQHFLFYK